MREQRRRDRVDTVRGNLIVRERRAHGGGGNRQRIANRSQAGEVAAAKRRRRHREGTGQRSLQPQAFVAAEEERSVAHQRTADRSAELALPERRYLLAYRPEVVRRIERIVAIELEQAAAESVGAGACD